MKVKWSIRSIKHHADDTWDALLVSTQDGRKVFDRVLSADGFNWKTKYHTKVRDDLQDDLTECIGDMVTHGITWVVF